MKTPICSNLFRLSPVQVTQIRFGFVLCAALITHFACSETEPSNKVAEIQAASESNRIEQGEPLVVYSGRGAVLIEPLLNEFTQKTQIPIEVRYEKSTQTLANRIATEADQTQADVFFAQDSGWLGALDEAGHLAVLNDDLLGRVPEHNRAKNGTWVGTSGRARVLVYSPERISIEDLPDRLADLPKVAPPGRVGWAPGNGSFQAHVSALRHIWGEEQTQSWLEQMNALEPKVYPKNSPQVKGVSNGEIDIGWVNHYYLHKLRSSSPGLEAANYSFREKGDAGNLMMLSGVGVISHSDNQKAAEAFVDFLLSDDAQSYFANKTFEYPTVPGIELHEDVPFIDEKINRANQEHLTDLSGTLDVLRRVGLQ
ncbi:extracellular solute-binding protein [Myxococcota bacterium]|nr:extracellular solute-binding protein [Myxococcota bacterium]